MKLWYQNGSEHSANIVMIGHFKDVAEATKACNILEMLRDQVARDQEEGVFAAGTPLTRYPDAMNVLLSDLGIHTIAPAELEQFTYDTRFKIQSDTLVLQTDEIDISAFLKVMIARGGRVEVYSAHDHKISTEPTE